MLAGRTMFRRLIWASLSVVALAGCKSERAAPAEDAAKFRRTAVTPQFPSEAVIHERSGTGSVRYLGMDVDPRTPERGAVVTVTHYFEVVRPMIGAYDVFVHGELPGGGGRALVADHAPVVGRAPTRTWKAGEIWADPHRVKIPEDVGTGTIELFVGLFKGKERLTVEAPAGGQDGSNRIRAATLRLGGPSPADDLPTVVVARASGPIVVDGKLDEAAWQKAQILEFSDTLGRGETIRFGTKLRLLYDDTHLYVGFDSVDHDITERYRSRDDPIYEHETVELFIMPNVVAPALGPYVELQASPGGVIFDASFDGRRIGMNKGFDAQQTIATTIDGTLNEDAPDRGWISEWAVPFEKIRGVDAAPKAGAEWRLNAFRIEKYRDSGKLRGEYSAWSPPKIGDFHNVVRFGRMKFGP